MRGDFFDNREQRQRVFSDLAEVFDHNLTLDAEAVQGEIYRRGKRETAYFLEKKFMAGYREPDTTGWAEFLSEFREYAFYEHAGYEDEYDYISKVGLENLADD